MKNIFLPQCFEKLCAATQKRMFNLYKVHPTIEKSLGIDYGMG